MPRCAGLEDGSLESIRDSAWKLSTGANAMTHLEFTVLLAYYVTNIVLRSDRKLSVAVGITIVCAKY